MQDYIEIEDWYAGDKGTTWRICSLDFSSHRQLSIRSTFNSLFIKEVHLSLEQKIAKSRKYFLRNRNATLTSNSSIPKDNQSLSKTEDNSEYDKNNISNLENGQSPSSMPFLTSSKSSYSSKPSVISSSSIPSKKRRLYSTSSYVRIRRSSRRRFFDSSSHTSSSKTKFYSSSSVLSSDSESVPLTSSKNGDVAITSTISSLHIVNSNKFNVSLTDKNNLVFDKNKTDSERTFLDHNLKEKMPSNIDNIFLKFKTSSNHKDWISSIAFFDVSYEVFPGM